jgi:hypothetical protein
MLDILLNLVSIVMMFLFGAFSVGISVIFALWWMNRHE